MNNNLKRIQFEVKHIASVSLDYFFETSSMADPNLAYLSFLLLLLPLSLFLFLYLIVRPRLVRIPIKNRHVFITGGSSGIGLALAHQVASEGARVSILARSLDKLEEAKQAIQLATGIEAAVFAADVRDYDAISRAVEKAGPIDVLIVNQGVFIPQELERQELDEVRFMLDVNLMGTFNMIKAALPAMKLHRRDRGPASIALMSSQAGQVGIYGYTAYSASKFGLRGLAEALQQEVIADDIHVSLIFPPDTDTPGLVEENKKRPQLTSIIAASSGSMKADEVAKRALSGIKSGGFIIPCNFEGLLLSIATAGLSPQRSFLMAFVEVVAAGIVRFVGLCFQWNWYGSIEKWHAQIKRIKKGYKPTIANPAQAVLVTDSQSVLTGRAVLIKPWFPSSPALPKHFPPALPTITQLASSTGRVEPQSNPMASIILKRTSFSSMKSMAGFIRTGATSFRAFAAKVEAGTDIVAAAPDVSLQKARTWDEGVSSKFATTPLKDIFRGKRVVIFGLPGAYTGVCSQQHVPSYKNNIDKFRAEKVDSVICVAINDPYAMNAWAEKLEAKDVIDFYGDFDGSFHKSLGLEKDLSAALLGPRSQRWSALVVDGKVNVLNVEENPSDFKVSGGEHILKQI